MSCWLRQAETQLWRHVSCKTHFLEYWAPSPRGKRSSRWLEPFLLSNRDWEWLPIPIWHLFFLQKALHSVSSSVSISLPVFNTVIKQEQVASVMTRTLILESFWINLWNINKCSSSRHLLWPGVFTLFDRACGGSMLKRVVVFYHSASHKQHIISHNSCLVSV